MSRQFKDTELFMSSQYNSLNIKYSQDEPICTEKVHVCAIGELGQKMIY